MPLAPDLQSAIAAEMHKALETAQRETLSAVLDMVREFLTTFPDATGDEILAALEDLYARVHLAQGAQPCRH